MPVNRSRIGRSSSFGDSGVLSPPVESADGWMERRGAPPSTATAKPPSNSAKSMKPSVAEKSAVSRPRILTLSSPVQESVDASDNQPIGVFLDKCYYCRKKIGENAEVFMYSYLRAFCTVECRDRQIATDNEMEKAYGKSEWMQISPTGILALFEFWLGKDLMFRHEMDARLVSSLEFTSAHRATEMVGDEPRRHKSGVSLFP